MASHADDYSAALEAASDYARSWLRSLGERPVPPRRSITELLDGFGVDLPEGPSDPLEVVTTLAEAAEPGLMAMGSGRFFGWVIGGSLPAALAADWMVSAWDQNAGLRFATPGVVAAEETAARWILQLLGLPTGASLGFVTGATMANFSCLAAARERVVRDAGWDIGDRGLAGGPRVRVLVGAQRHDTIDLTLRYLGLGSPVAVPADTQGRIEVEALRAELDSEPSTPTIVCLQAGNLHSGAFDPFAAAIAAAHQHGAWVHIDGAFGLWAGASDRLRDLVAGYEAADSWTTDAHKTLNVPYDCGIAIVAQPADHRAALGMHADYLIEDAAGDPLDFVPEMSRRARGVPVWAALRSLGRSGVAALVDGLVFHAQSLAAGLAAIDGLEVLNDVVYTQVSVAFADDDRTRAVEAQLLAGGVTWMSGSRWRGRRVIRVSVSNWATDSDDVLRSVEAMRAAITRVDSRAAAPS